MTELDSPASFNFVTCITGSKVIPDGAPDALGGLTFVFTGELESISREEAQTLAKRYGGWV